MTLLDLISVWPHFIPHIIINDIAPFNEIIGLAQTCKELNQYFYRNLKAYYILCQYYLKKISMVIFMRTEELYHNANESMIFIKLYKFYKYKISIKNAIEWGCIVILDYYLTIDNREILFLQSDIINNASFNGHINVLDWLYRRYLHKKCIDESMSIYCSEAAIKYAAINNHINVLNWFFKHDLFKLELSEKLIDGIVRFNHTEALNWFFKHSTQYYKINGINIKYSEAIDIAAEFGFVDVLNIFFEHRYYWGFKYTNNAIDNAAANNYVNVLNWFFEREEYLEFKYQYAVDNAAAHGYITILDWFFNNFKDAFIYSKSAIDTASAHNIISVLNWFLIHSTHYLGDAGIKLKYSHYALDPLLSKADHHYYSNTIVWWKNSGLPLKYTITSEANSILDIY